MRTYTKHPLSRRGFSPLTVIPDLIRDLGVKPLQLLFALCALRRYHVASTLGVLFALPFKLLPHKIMRKLSSTQRLFLNMIVVTTILIFGIFIYTTMTNPEQTKAAWFDGNWLYRTSIPITNGSGSELTNYQILIATDTARMITEGKLQSDCDDLRIVNANGAVLPHWVETGAKGCNTAVTNIWVKVPVIPTSGGQLFLYYANTSATNIQNGNKVFELFDDFSGNSLDSAKWTTGTIGATSGTDFTVSGGLLSGGNTNRTITSIKSFTGNYSAETRTYTTTSPVNGFTPIGFWSSTANGWALLDHNATSYYRNDGTWVNFAYNGNTQWTRNTAKVVGTTGTYARVGETSGSATSTGTNSGISGENIRLSARSDNSATNQDYAANWDWILVRKAVATEPTTSISTEEQSPAPVAYWKFDEGTGTVSYDSSANKYNGTISGATWKQEGDCIIGKCLYFDGVNDYIDLGSSTRYGADKTTGSYTVEAWVKPTDVNRYNVVTRYIGGGDYFSAGVTGQSGWLRNMVKDTVGSVNYWPDTNKSAISANTWNHITFIYSTGVGYKYYVNGNLIRSIANTNIHFFNYAATAYIGIGTDANSYFKGYMDEVKVYPYERSANQVKLDYSSRGSVQGVALQAGGTDNSPLSNGLVGYWKMDETSWNGTSNEVVDSSGNANHGTSVLGTEASPSAKFGRAGYFAGNDEAISVADSASLDLGDTLTISLWAKRGTVGVNNYIMQKGSGPYAIGFNASNQLYLDMPGTGNVFTSTAAFTDTSSYHHIVFAKKGASLLVYFDGAVVAGTFTNRTLTDNSSALYLGSNSGNTAARYPGNMDEVRLYNRQLSPNEIQQLYSFAPGPIFYAPLDEGSGTTTTDNSGNNYNGTFTGSPSWTQGKYGKALKFTRGSTVRSAATVSSGPLSNLRNHTVSFWFKFTQSPDNAYRKLFGYHTTSDRNPAVWTCPNLLSFHWKLDPGNTGSNCQGPTGDNSSQFTLNQWYHIEVTKEGTVGVVYINGIRINALTFVDVNGNGTGTLFLGSDGSYGTPGFIFDEFKIYNYARTPGQVVSDMNAGHPIGGSPVGSQALYTKFDEGYGTTAKDSGPNKINGTITNCAWTLNSKYNKGLNCNGGGYVTLGSNTAFDSPSFSYTFWIKTGSLGVDQYNNIILGRETYTVSGFRMGLGSSGRVYFWTSQSGGTLSLTSTNSVSNGNWHYIAVTYDSSSSTGTIYIDGNKDTTSTGTYIIPTGVSLILNGGIGGTTRSNSSFDELKIYSSALSASDIKLDYNHGSSLVLGATSDTSGLTGGSVASNSASAAYCVPGDTSTCTAPVAEWKFDEKAGTTANDTSGNGRTGTLTSGPSWAQGKIGSGLSFDGSDDYVSTTNGVDISSGDWTMQAWIYPTAYGAQWRHVFGAEAQTFAFGIASGSLDVTNVSVADCTVSSTTPSLNRWSHIAATFVDSSNTLTYYVNGAKGNTVTCNTTPTAARKTQYIGRSLSYTSAFQGKIDEPRIYNYVRTPAQVAYDYNRGKPVAQWKMDECQGGTINDSSGNGNAGTITIGATGTQGSVGTCSTSSTAWGNGATGKFNSSLNFDGTDDYAKTTNGSENMHNDITLSAWFRTTSVSPIVMILCLGDESPGERRCILQRQNTIEFNGYSADLRGTRTFGANEWHHAAITRTGTTIKIYFDGVLDISGSPNGTLNDFSSTSVNIGSNNANGEMFSGQIDDAQVFNYALTKQQVQNVMNQGGAVRFGPNTGAP